MIATTETQDPEGGAPDLKFEISAPGSQSRKGLRDPVVRMFKPSNPKVRPNVADSRPEKGLSPGTVPVWKNKKPRDL